MSETPEEKDGLDTVDDLAEEAAWREERKWSFAGWLGFRRGRFGRDAEPPPGGPGLREALHGDDEEN